MRSFVGRQALARPHGIRCVPATAKLLQLYANPGGATVLAPRDWSSVLGAARRSRTLGHLGLRLLEAGVLPQVDPRITRHFLAARNVVRERRRLLRWELLELADALRDTACDIVLLKGAAYELQELPLAAARIASDIDLLVPRAHLATVERSLLARGWNLEEMSDYDERYYREWSHELPPFMHPMREVEVDVHHSITPSLSSDSEAMRLLLRDARTLRWPVGARGRVVERFKALAPIDQVVHAAVHTFGDSDLALRLREVMDFDWLYRRLLAEQGADAPVALARRARELGQTRPMHWALHFARRWLGTPVPADVLAELARSPARTRLMEWLADRAMLPGERQHRRPIEAFAETALLARHHWQRMPLPRLVPHLARKAVWRMRTRAGE